MPAEQNYKPIEGEALALVNGLKKSKYFTLGCQDLLVTTDHKSDRHLEEIENPMLKNLKEKTLEVYKKGLRRCVKLQGFGEGDCYKVQPYFLGIVPKSKTG